MFHEGGKAIRRKTGMYLSSCPREQLLHLLPKRGVVAEIGTAKGAFAAAILRHADPAALHLIDPWVHHAEGDYTRDLSNVGGDEQEARYRDVLRMFGAEIANGRVVVHRRTSADTAESFADGDLDWIYVDGLHSFDGVLADLSAYAPKLKPDGLILGHDYTNNFLAQHQAFGVVEAVNRFVAESAFDLVLLTLEAFPTYLLARPGGCAAAIVAALLHAGAIVAEIEGYPAAGTFVHRAYEVGDRRGVLPVFRMARSDPDNGRMS